MPDERIDQIRELGPVRESYIALLDSLMASPSVGIGVLDLEMRFLRANEAMSALSGRSPTGHVGRALDEVVPGLAPAMRPLLRQVIETGKPVIVAELRGETPAAPSQERCWTTSYYPLRGRRGETAGVACVFTEITARKQAEAAVSTLQFELAGQLADMTRLQEMTARLSNGVELQPVMDEVLGAVTSLLGADMGTLMLYDAERGDLCLAASSGLLVEYLQKLGRVAAGQGGSGRSIVERRRVIIPDVEVDPLLGRCVDAARLGGYRAGCYCPLLTRHGDVIGTVAAYFPRPHQPSERELRLVDLYVRQAAHAIDNARLYAAIQEADRQKNRFLAMLGHELRNPLGAISNAAQVLKTRTGSDPDLIVLQATIERQVTQQARLIDDLLNVARIARGKIDLQPERMNLSSLVRDNAEACRQPLADAGLELELRLPETAVWVEGDPARLSQVVGNLLHNSTKFTAHGGRVELALEAVDGWAVVAVQDTGIGIEPDLLPRVFEPFVQADTSLERTQGGLGLGLALVKELVDLHRGTVSAVSGGRGQGSTFVVRLPLASAPPEAAASPPGVRAPSSRILIIEDNVDAANTLGALLRSFGHTVEVAYFGMEGLEAARRFLPDVVLCDLGLPHMDGYAVARSLRRDPATARTRLIAVSGYGQDEDRQRSLDAGFDRHLTKPVDPSELEQLLAPGSHEATTAAPDGPPAPTPDS